MEDSTSVGNRSTHVMKNVKKLRLRVKPRMSQAKLAREADVSPDTLRKAERGEAVTESVAVAVFEALNKHYNGSLDFSEEVKSVL